MKTWGNAFHFEFLRPLTPSPHAQAMVFFKHVPSYIPTDLNPNYCEHKSRVLWTNSIFLCAPLTCAQLPRDHLLILTPRGQRSPCLCDWNGEGVRGGGGLEAAAESKVPAASLGERNVCALESLADLTRLTSRGRGGRRRRVTPKAKKESTFGYKHVFLSKARRRSSFQQPSSLVSAARSLFWR